MAATCGRPAPLPPDSCFQLLACHGKAHFGQASQEAVITVIPGDLQADQLVLERPFARFQEIHEHVHRGRVLAGNLRAGNKLDADLTGSRPGGRDAVLTVVVSQRHG